MLGIELFLYRHRGPSHLSAIARHCGFPVTASNSNPSMIHPSFKMSLGFKMKKLIVALAAVAAFSGSASAADLAARPYTKAPMMAPVYNWTGDYFFGGGGGGLFSADSNVNSFPGGVGITRDQRLGGDGWFGTVGAGYDWQFSSWVAGIFADGQFGEIRGSLSDPNFGTEGREKLRTSYAAGARIGYLVAPNVLSYVNAGYSGSQWSGTSMSVLGVGGTP